MRMISEERRREGEKERRREGEKEGRREGGKKFREIAALSGNLFYRVRENFMESPKSRVVVG